jgi:hypothetical protein
MTSTPWSRPDIKRKTLVQVLDVESIFPLNACPFTTEDQDGVPYIVLPCHSPHPLQEAEQQWALATALHEATHVFNCRIRPLSSPYSFYWAWFDEALAVYMETLHKYRDNFRFLRTWIEKPELSLDNSDAYYQAGQFLAYLVGKMGVEFVNRVWMESAPGEKPFEAITRMLPANETLVSADPNKRDLFASGYCMDSWFLNDPASEMYSPELYRRFGERAVTESFVMKSGWKVETTDKPEEQEHLDHLACRYYRFYIKDNMEQLSVELHSPDEAGTSPLKAELASVTKEGRRERVISLLPAPGNSRKKTRLQTTVKTINPKQLDHFILTVTNCGVSRQHDDRKRYTIKASAG